MTTPVALVEQARAGNREAFDVLAARSPDGRTVAFTGWVGPQANGIVAANADGSGVRKITDGHIRTGYPRWSPDGRWIAFRTEKPDSTGLNLVAPDGSPGGLVRSAEDGSAECGRHQRTIGDAKGPISGGDTRKPLPVDTGRDSQVSLARGKVAAGRGSYRDPR